MNYHKIELNLLHDFDPKSFACFVQPKSKDIELQEKQQILPFDKLEIGVSSKLSTDDFLSFGELFQR